jgi:hypothetical protein
MITYRVLRVEEETCISKSTASFPRRKEGKEGYAPYSSVRVLNIAEKFDVISPSFMGV